MKKRCYPKYSYIIFIVLSVVLFIFSAVPLFIKTNEETAPKIIWSAVMLFLSITFILASIQYMQYYCFEDDYLIVKSAFGTIMKLNIPDIQAVEELLPTYFSSFFTIEIRWICIYDKSISDNFLSKFKSGCSNNKKIKRIQIIYTDENAEIIKQFISDYTESDMIE